MDGQQQRRALNAAEQALTALERGDAAGALHAASEAAELDQIGAFAAFATVIATVAGDLAAGGVVGAAAWQQVAGSLDGPLRARAAGHAS